MKKWEKPKAFNIGIESTNSCRAWIGPVYGTCVKCHKTSSYTIEEILAIGVNNVKCKQTNCDGDVIGCGCPSIS